jgi:formyltetrahydrofolate deformylase
MTAESRPERHGENTATLLLSCPDQHGVLAAISKLINENGDNILRTDAHTDRDLNLYLARMEWALNDSSLAMEDFAARFTPVAKRFGMQWRLALSANRPQMAIFVSRNDHCLTDLLYRHNIGELLCDIPFILSNHEDCRRLAEFYSVPYHVITVDKDNKRKAEDAARALLNEHKIDLIVLARYMQILSTDFINQYPNRIINIHHSFLPAFIGAKPYHRSYERGVKLVGATSHYVTEVLDEGPIIEQDVIRISHRDTLRDLIEKGRDLER